LIRSLRYQVWECRPHVTYRPEWTTLCYNLDHIDQRMIESTSEVNVYCRLVILSVVRRRQSRTN